MKTVIVLMVLLPVLNMSLKAQGTQWKVSVAILGTIQAMDIASSWNQYEANPLARNQQGRFSPAKAIPIKAGIVLGTVLLQKYILKRYPKEQKYFVGANVVTSVIMGSITVRNWKVRD